MMQVAYTPALSEQIRRSRESEWQITPKPFRLINDKGETLKRMDPVTMKFTDEDALFVYTGVTR